MQAYAVIVKHFSEGVDSDARAARGSRKGWAVPKPPISVGELDKMGAKARASARFPASRVRARAHVPRVHRACRCLV